MFKNLQYKLAWVIIALIICVIGGTLLFLQQLYLPAAFCVLLTIVCCISLVRIYRYNIRKITFMFNAIESGDYAFHFSDNESAIHDNTFNQTLNRIKGLLFKARQEIREQEKYYELILSNVITGIVVLNDKGFVFQTNAEARRLLDLPVFTHVHQLSRLDESLPTIFLKMCSGDTQSVTLYNERGTSHLSLQASEVIIRGERMKIISINDIDRQLDEKELESWIRLTRVLTHEIMNAITPITSLSDTLLQLHGDKDDDIHRGLEVIQTTSRGLIAFVESYRRFTRIPQPDFKLLYVKKLLEQQVALGTEIIPNEKIQIAIDVEPDDLMIQADENQISQVILNLIKNAVAALDGRSDGWIRIKARCDQEENVTIEVANNGAPIPPEVAEQIFVPFFTTKTDGSGIGLSISRQIMRLHHGSIKLLYSNNRETVFLLTFR